MPDRLVLTPSAGRLLPLDDDLRPRPGDLVLAGQVVALLEVSRAEVEIRTPFTGVVGDVMAVDGERLRDQQPVVWLRVGRPLV
ncbi:MAG TPA: biotin/lipoyl-containing protein [Acidimicrobiales bacterium]